MGAKIKRQCVACSPASGSSISNFTLFFSPCLHRLCKRFFNFNNFFDQKRDIFSRVSWKATAAFVGNIIFRPITSCPSLSFSLKRSFTLWANDSSRFDSFDRQPASHAKLTLIFHSNAWNYPKTRSIYLLPSLLPPPLCVSPLFSLPFSVFLHPLSSPFCFPLISLLSSPFVVPSSFFPYMCFYFFSLLLLTRVNTWRFILLLLSVFCYW